MEVQSGILQRRIDNWNKLSPLKKWTRLAVVWLWLLWTAVSIDQYANKGKIGYNVMNFTSSLSSVLKAKTTKEIAWNKTIDEMYSYLWDLADSQLNLNELKSESWMWAISKIESFLINARSTI